MNLKLAFSICLLSYFVIYPTDINARENKLDHHILVNSSSNDKSDALSAEFLFKRGNDKFDLGHFQEAIQDYDAILATQAIGNVSKAMILTNRGVAKASLKQFQEAIEDFDMILAAPKIDDELKADTLRHRDLAKVKLGQHRLLFKNFIIGFSKNAH